MSKSNYPISILVPVYGVEKYIERCARSLFEQTYENIEYIFVDDCSPDKSIEVLQQVLNEYPHRKKQVRIVRHETNRGLAAARNTAVENCKTDFLMHVDSDDYIDRTLVEKCVKEQERTNCDIVLFDFVVLKKNGNVTMRHVRCNSIYERTVKLLERRTPVCVCGGFYRLSLYKDNEITAVIGINNNEDYLTSPRLSYFSKKISYLDDELYYYDNTNNSSITHIFNVSHAEQGWKSIEYLKVFFKDKGQDYMDAIQIATIDRVATYLKDSIKAGNREYYNEMRIKQQNVGMTMANTVPLSRRIYLYIDSYVLLKFYTLLGVFYKRHV